MIKRLINKLLGKNDSAAGQHTFGKRVEVPASVHHIDPQLVDERAAEVVRTLKKAGFEAYIVGGAVRDLLAGLKPKDFDVATNATPEEVKRLFRRAFIIGRRFRIVHVVFGRGREHEVVEVSTFRAYLDAAAAEQVSGNEKTSRHALAGVQHAVDASGRVLRDNVWGRQEEDAARRDFTINAMYYDPESQIVVDYHKGMADAQKRVLRMIGDAAQRYREDPVRLMRAVRISAKLAGLGFKLERNTAAPLKQSLALLENVPQSRMFDEMLKLLQTGHALASIAQLQKLGLQDGIYPLLTLAVQRAEDHFVQAAFKDTDRRVAEDKPVAASFLLSCLLWQDVRQAWQAGIQAGNSSFVALQQAIDEVFDARIGDVSGRGKLGADMREIWMMQPRFEKRTGNSPYSLVAQLRYRAGFDFLRLRASVGEVDEAIPDWWQTFSTANDTLREDLIAQVREQMREQQRMRQRKPQREGDAPQTDDVGDVAGARKPRSRRRKPRTRGQAAHDSGMANPAAADDVQPSRAGRDAASGAADQPQADAPAKKPRRRRKPSSKTSGSGAEGGQPV
jgi:poly(A) polymerase